MDTISVSEFQQRCLSLLDDLPADGLLLTRHGHAVARVVPVRQSCADLIGTVAVLPDTNDDLFTTGERWNAES